MSIFIMFFKQMLWAQGWQKKNFSSFSYLKELKKTKENLKELKKTKENLKELKKTKENLKELKKT